MFVPTTLHCSMGSSKSGAANGPGVTDPAPWASTLYEFWPLDESSAASDAIGVKAVYDVTAVSSPGVGGSGRGTAYRTFNGSQGFTKASNTNLAGASLDYWVSAWFYPTTISGNHQIAGSMSSAGAFDGQWNWFLYLDSSGNVKFSSGNGGGSFQAPITMSSGLTVNNQYHIALTLKADGSFKYCFNGGTVTTTTSTPTSAGLSLGGLFTIGGKTGQAVSYQGRIKCVAFGSSTTGNGGYLSDALLQGLYNGGVPILHT